MAQFFHLYWMPSPQLFLIAPSPQFPSSPFPVVHYRSVMYLPWLQAGAHVKRLFHHHQWTNSWKSGVFTYDHYHSTAHESLGFIRGNTTLRLGGENGREVAVGKGDVLIIPAGVAHKNLGSRHKVTCIGAYADGRTFDINTGKPGERPATDYNIQSVPFPSSDPIYGPDKGICRIWSDIDNFLSVPAASTPD